MLKLYSSLAFVITCVACGSSFTDNGRGDGLGHAGDANGGETSSAGSSSGGDAGETDVGGTSSGGDAGAGDSTAGSAGAGAGAGQGGSATAGSGGSAGSVSGPDCAKLKADYQAALEKARVCDKGSTDQCSASSTVEPLSCGCAVLVNAKSEFTAAAKKARQAFRDAKCVDNTLCSAVACQLITDASCAPGVATGSTFVCTSVTALAN